LAQSFASWYIRNEAVDVRPFYAEIDRLGEPTE
jgi:hypothetical protein